MRPSSVVAIVVSGLAGLLVPATVQGWHASSPAPVWEEYHASRPASSRIIGWRACGMTDYEENLAGVAFSNWKAKFGHSINHTKYGDGCSFPYDLRVQALPTEEMWKCDWHPACITMFYYTHDNHLDVSYAQMMFDYVWLDGLWNTGPQMHVFAHEFGHPMSLADAGSHTCGTSVMSGAGCEDLVHDGAYPNDVCFPDYYLGYGQARC